MKKTLFLSVIVLLIAGCSTQQNIQQKPRKVQQIDPQKQVIEQVQAVQPRFSTLQAQKVKVSLEYGQYKLPSSSGSLNIVHDSAVILSLQPLLGIELYRIEISKRGISVIDKLNRRYADLTFKTMQETLGAGVEYEDIEALLTGCLFAAGAPDSTLATLSPSVTTDEDQNLHIIAFATGPAEYVFHADRQQYTLQKSTLSHRDSKGRAEVRYMNWQPTEDTIFPQTIEVSASTPETSGKCTVSMNTIVLNGKADVKQVDTGKYTKTDISNLFK